MMCVRTVLVAAVVAVALTPALAATEADCEAAVEKAQRDAASDPALGEGSGGRSDELATMLAQASEAGLQGDAEKCLALVRDARGAAGLERE